VIAHRFAFGMAHSVEVLDAFAVLMHRYDNRCVSGPGRPWWWTALAFYRPRVDKTKVTPSTDPDDAG